MFRILSAWHLSRRISTAGTPIAQAAG